jgi:hypothetical protein
MIASRFKTACVAAEASRLCSISVSSTSATRVSHLFSFFWYVSSGTVWHHTIQGKGIDARGSPRHSALINPFGTPLRSHHGEERATDRDLYRFTDLREHAVFTLRNILHDSPENQAVVDSFRADEHVVGGTTVM